MEKGNTANIIEKWDTYTNTQYWLSIAATYSPTKYTFQKSSDRTNWPLLIPGQGMYFNSTTWSYYLIDNPNLALSYYLPFPPMFSLEAWVKYDTMYPAPDSQLMTIFAKSSSLNILDDPSQRANNYKVGFALGNYFMRVYVNNLYYDLDYPFLTNGKWQHIQVAY